MPNHFSSTAILVTNDGLGHADPELGHKLARNYFHTMIELEQRPQSILFYGEGVKLTTKGSPCINELTALSSAGVPLVVCRTCLDHYGLTDKVAVGEIGNMLRIFEAQAVAKRVITV